jgi:hypothetical protein
LLTVAGACGSNDKTACDPAAQTGCASGLFCEAVQNGTPACFAPVLVRGTVSDPTTKPAALLLNDARVVALDANRAPLSTVAVTANDGTTNGAYELKVRATRDSSGKPVQASFTLRADKQGYQAFPGGIRTALPIDLSSATLTSGSWIVSGPLTTLQLLPLTGGGTAFVHGTVAKPSSGAGTLVVAEPAAGGAGLTGIADDSGSYAIYNLAPGTQYVITAYAKGVNYVPVTTAALVPGDNTVSRLALGSGTGATVTGGLIFNNGVTDPVAVALVVESTYDPILDRGETPPGLAVQSAASGYSFTNVPDGKYIVLAAFDADGNVRDVSCPSPPCTNNTQPVVVIVQGGSAGAVGQFKITRAISGLTIAGATPTVAPMVVSTSTPVFTWTKANAYSSAQTYRVTVYDSTGNVAWTVDQPGGNSNSVTPPGGTIVAGDLYQLRIAAFANVTIPVDPTLRNQLSQTEDVLGVFTYQP